VRFFLIRHSTRETPEDFSDAEEGDPEAELTDEGREIAESLGKRMAEQELLPQVMYVSPTVRAQQTAEIIAEALEEAGYTKPEVKIDVGLGPHMSIRSTVLKALKDESTEDVAIVSHRDTIKNGLMNLGKGDKPTPMAMGELRVLKIKRKSGKWQEQEQVLPSDLGHPESY
jgi:phosphohistidine phosphatase SixA